MFTGVCGIGVCVIYTMDVVDNRDNLTTARSVVERLNNRLDELEAKGLKDSKQSRMYYWLLRYYTNRVTRLERELQPMAHGRQSTRAKA